MKMLGPICCLLLTMLTASSCLADDTPEWRIEHAAVLPCSLAEAWHLWTTNDGIQNGIGVQGSDIELKLGGKYEIYFGMTNPVGQRGSEGCTVLCYHPMEMLAFSWNAPPSIPELRNAGSRTQVIIRFASVTTEQTKITLTQSGRGTGKAWDQYQQYFKNAWPKVLEQMTKYVSNPERTTRNIAPAPGLNQLVHEAVINGTVGEVWKAFTTKAGLESWMVAQASFDLKVGGKMLTTYNKNAVLGDENTIENTIRAFQTERMLVIQCTKTPKGFPFAQSFMPTWSVCYFEPVDDKQTKVRLVGLNYGTDEESLKTRKFFEAGNNQVMQSLKKRFEAK